VRFHSVGDGKLPPLQLAWYEPVHHIVEATAPWFAKRSRDGRWAILTPERSVEWDGRQLHFAPGVPREQAPPQELPEGVLLAHYRTVFGARARDSSGDEGAIAP
jgi:DNA polymerase